MSKEISITIGFPRRRIMAVRGAIYILAAAYHCRLISAKRAHSIGEKLAHWLADGVRAK